MFPLASTNSLNPISGARSPSSGPTWVALFGHRGLLVSHRQSDGLSTARRALIQELYIDFSASLPALLRSEEDGIVYGAPALGVAWLSNTLFESDRFPSLLRLILLSPSNHPIPREIESLRAAVWHVIDEANRLTLETDGRVLDGRDLEQYGIRGLVGPVEEDDFEVKIVIEELVEKEWETVQHRTRHALIEALLNNPADPCLHLSWDQGRRLIQSACSNPATRIHFNILRTGPPPEQWEKAFLRDNLRYLAEEHRGQGVLLRGAENEVVQEELEEFFSEIRVKWGVCCWSFDPAVAF